VVPVVLLTGFLGSGKTTLLNQLLETRADSSAEDGKRMAIVVNEFGDIGIDGDLLPSEMTRQVELPGGCICCVLSEDLDTTLNELLDGEPDLALIVIETTGIAEPLSISWALAREPLSERVRLAAVLTVVDAVEHERHRPLSPSVDAQVEYADILIVSKLDLAGLVVAPPALVDHLRSLNQFAAIVDGTPQQIAEVLWRFLDDPERGQAGVLDQLGDDVPVQPHHHFESVSLPIDETLDFEELSAQLEELPPSYIRIKGIATVVDGTTGSAEPHVIAFHRVGARVSRERLEPTADTIDKRIVAIGRGVDPSQLAACVNAAVVPCSD